MSIQQFLIYIIIIGVCFASYTAHRAKSKIYCTFVRRDGTVGHKWAKAQNGERIEFAGGWYYVVMKRITHEALDSGFNMIWPTMVRRLEFTYKSVWPLDPETGKAEAETPESRKNLNKREDIESYNRGSQAAVGKVKMGGMFGTGLLPIILVVGIVACLYFIFQMRGQIDNLGNAINVIESLITKK